MAPLRKPEYDRAHILDAANRARTKKKPARAIELYRRVLAREPHNGELHAKLAPLLAETHQSFDAWCSFKAVARAFLRAKQPEKALAVYRDATLYLPQEVHAWFAAASLLQKSGRGREAVETLIDGSRRFRIRWQRPQAIFLLRRAREVDEWNFDAVLELARLLAQTSQKHEAGLLLDGLVQRCEGQRLRRARGAQLALSPGIGTALRWLRAALGRREEEPEASPPAPVEEEQRPARRSTVVPIRLAR